MRLVETPGEVFAAGLCIGCGACAAPDEPLELDRHGQLTPGAALRARAVPDFARRCPFSPGARDEDAIAAARFPTARVRDARIGTFERAYVGHVAEGEYRAKGSSGGLVTWVAAELLRRGLVDGVAHVSPGDPATGERFFGYRVSRSVAALQGGAKSRYYPVELSQVLAEIRRVPGRYAVVGVPCFIKAVHLACDADPVLAERVAYTLGLFCGHMKGAAFVESFAWQLGAPLGEVQAVEYRRKDAGRPANWYTAQLTLADGSQRQRDWFHLADGDWGAGFFQHPACDYCDDVVAETADVSFGDAWVEPYASDGRGTNVVVVRAPELRDLVAEAIGTGRLTMDEVDADFIAQTQAAGLRQRREGLAYRLRIAPPRLPLAKRVAPMDRGGGRDLPWRRKLVYRLRRRITRDGRRVFLAARASGWHGLYLRWARAMLHVYEAVTYKRHRLGRVVAWLEGSAPERRG